MAEYAVDLDIDVQGVRFGPDAFYVEDNDYNHIEHPTAQQIAATLRDDGKESVVRDYFCGDDFTITVTVQHPDGRHTVAEV